MTDIEPPPLPAAVPAKVAKFPLWWLAAIAVAYAAVHSGGADLGEADRSAAYHAGRWSGAAMLVFGIGGIAWLCSKQRLVAILVAVGVALLPSFGSLVGERRKLRDAEDKYVTQVKASLDEIRGLSDQFEANGGLDPARLGERAARTRLMESIAEIRARCDDVRGELATGARFRRMLDGKQIAESKLTENWRRMTQEGKFEQVREMLRVNGESLEHASRYVALLDEYDGRWTHTDDGVVFAADVPGAALQRFNESVEEMQSLDVELERLRKQYE